MDNKYQKQLDTLNKLNSPIEKTKRYTYSIKDLKKESFIKINSELFYVEEISTYLETKWNFKKKNNDYIVTELKLYSLESGEYTYIEYEEDDYLEVFITTKILSMKDLRFNNSPVTTSVIDYIEDEEEGIVSYNNVNYHYSDEESWAAIYNSEKHKDIRVRMFEFESNSESLTIEFWFDDDEKPSKEVFISKELNIKKIEIIQL